MAWFCGKLKLLFVTIIIFQENEKISYNVERIFVFDWTKTASCIEMGYKLFISRPDHIKINIYACDLPSTISGKFPDAADLAFLHSFLRLKGFGSQSMITVSVYLQVETQSHKILLIFVGCIYGLRKNSLTARWSKKHNRLTLILNVSLEKFSIHDPFP